MKNLIIGFVIAIGLSAQPKTKEIETLIWENKPYNFCMDRIKFYDKYGYSVKALTPIHSKVITSGSWTDQKGDAYFDKFTLILQK